MVSLSITLYLVSPLSTTPSCYSLSQSLTILSDDWQSQDLMHLVTLQHHHILSLSKLFSRSSYVTLFSRTSSHHYASAISPSPSTLVGLLDSFLWILFSTAVWLFFFVKIWRVSPSTHLFTRRTRMFNLPNFNGPTCPIPFLTNSRWDKPKWVEPTHFVISNWVEIFNSI